MLTSVLWELLAEKQVQQLSAGDSPGHLFEDFTVQMVHTACHRLGTLKTFPPRYTLKLPTVSGLSYQIDVVVREGSSNYHLIECKFKQSASVEELYAFNAKLLDYAFGAQSRGYKTRVRGYFLTTSEVSDNFHQYALAWGITLIAPSCTPPAEHMLSKVKPNTPLHSQLTRLVEKTLGAQPFESVARACEIRKLLVEWRSCYQRWKQAGYGI